MNNKTNPLKNFIKMTLKEKLILMIKIKSIVLCYFLDFFYYLYIVLIYFNGCNSPPNLFKINHFE